LLCRRYGELLMKKVLFVCVENSMSCVETNSDGDSPSIALGDGYALLPRPKCDRPA